MTDKLLYGLPLATRSWTLRFELDGSPSDPSAITCVITHLQGGVPTEIDRLDKTDLEAGETGEFVLTITPENAGDFEVQIYTSGDTDTVHNSIRFNVPTPIGSYGD